MAYTKITSAYHGAKAISYLLGESHKEGVERNMHLSGINMVSPDAVSYTEQMQTYWDRASDRMKVQVRRVTQSASRKEIDPENEADLLKFHEVGIETGRRVFGNRQFIVATQIDGKSGLANNHIFANNVDFITVKGMRGDDYQHSRIKQISDEVFQEFGIEIDEGEKHGSKYTQAERVKRDRGEYVWKDDLKDRITESLEASTDYKSFEDALAFRGVSARFGKTITYTLDDTTAYEDFYDEPPKNPLKVRGKKLGNAFDVKHIEDTFLQNQGIDITQAPEIENDVDGEEIIQDSVEESSEVNRKGLIESATLYEEKIPRDDLAVCDEVKNSEEEVQEEVSKAVLGSVNYNTKQEEEPKIEEAQEDETKAFEFKLNVQPQLNMQQDVNDEARQKAEEDYAYKMAVLRRMNIPNLTVDGFVFDDEDIGDKY